MSGDSNHADLGRTLIYFPVINNTQADTANLRESMWQITRQKLGKNDRKLKANLIDELWFHIERSINYWPLSYEKVRLYQDGLPVSRWKAKIVTEMAKAGSLNHRLLLQLMEKGATIMGTESPEFLIQEYELVKQTLCCSDTMQTAKAVAYQNGLSESLLKRRGQYIADRINSTLHIGETGILFLGIVHLLGNWLDKDIQVIYPINRPFGYGSKENEKTKRFDSDRR